MTTDSYCFNAKKGLKVTRMMSFWQRLLSAGCIGALLCNPVYAIPQSPRWGMATAEDILSALGPDGQGLPLTADKLPDLFDLTASRLDEQPKKFIVEQPYVSGRWKGGKAVIEYARD